jgi:hypothetical protein
MSLPQSSSVVLPIALPPLRSFQRPMSDFSVPASTAAQFPSVRKFPPRHGQWNASPAPEMLPRMSTAPGAPSPPGLNKFATVSTKVAPVQSIKLSSSSSIQAEELDAPFIPVALSATRTMSGCSSVSSDIDDDHDQSAVSACAAFEGVVAFANNDAGQPPSLSFRPVLMSAHSHAISRISTSCAHIEYR